MLQGPTVDSLPVREDDSVLLDGMLQSWALGYDKYRSVIDQFAFFANDASRVAVEPVSSFDWTANPPYIKLPSALGIVLATLLNLGSFPLFYLGRFFNLLMFAALAYFAVRITPVGKNAMMVAGLLPMTLHLASSYSYDAGIMGLAFLLTGMCLRAVYGEGLMSRREKAGIVVVAVLLAPCKVVYTVIVLLVILIPRKRFSSAAASARFKVVAIGFALLSLLVFRAAGLLQMAGVASSSTAEGSRGDEYGTFYSLSLGSSRIPLNTVLLFLRNVRRARFFLPGYPRRRVPCLVPSRSQGTALHHGSPAVHRGLVSATLRRRQRRHSWCAQGFVWRFGLGRGFGRDTFDADRVDVHQRKRRARACRGVTSSRCFPWPRWRCEVNI